LKHSPKRNILIVEDSFVQVQVLSMILEEIGMTFEVAHDMATALELIGTINFDAVMLDLTLPDSKGSETVVRVAQFQPTLPIVVMTASEGEEVSFQALQDGAEDYLLKGDVEQADVERSLRYAIERKKQSNRVYESQQSLRSTIENSYNAFLSVNEDLTIVEWNTSAEELFGYTSTEVIGKRLCDQIFAANDVVVSEELLNCFRGEESRLFGSRCELVAVHRSGKKFPAEVAFFAVKQGDKKTICSFVADITDRKEFEQHAAEFYSMVAHELRTPLTTIKGSMSLIVEKLVDPEEEAELLQIGIGSCERLISLINDLLEISKFEAGKMPLYKVAYHSSELISRAIAECSSSCKNAAITIVRVEKSNYELTVDPDRIVQVLINLLSNALKYSPNKSIVTLSCELTNENKVRFSITDQGPGIPPQGLSRLFQKFQQVQEDTSQQKEGTGLGLAITKAIVGHHKGDIGVSSTLGKGTTFWFELPAPSNDTIQPGADVNSAKCLS
jgi:PAS domain S-box-containing protein